MCSRDGGVDFCSELEAETGVVCCGEEGLGLAGDVLGVLVLYMGGEFGGGGWYDACGVEFVVAVRFEVGED